MSANDYVKFITQTVVKYIDQPKEERKKIRQQRKETKETFLFRWFGVIPYLLFMNRRKKR